METRSYLAGWIKNKYNEKRKLTEECEKKWKEFNNSFIEIVKEVLKSEVSKLQWVAEISTIIGNLILTPKHDNFFHTSIIHKLQQDVHEHFDFYFLNKKGFEGFPSAALVFSDDDFYIIIYRNTMTNDEIKSFLKEFGFTNIVSNVSEDINKLQQEIEKLKNSDKELVDILEDL